MKSLMQKLFLSCKKYTELVERAREEEMSSIDKMRMFMHRKMCQICDYYKRQSESIEKILEKEYADIEKISSEGDSTPKGIDAQEELPRNTQKVKEEILSKIENHGKN